jgi:hypothetical protein
MISTTTRQIPEYVKRTLLTLEHDIVSVLLKIPKVRS